MPLLLAWMALLGADRVDLFGTQGPFTLTPFLVLSPLVVASEWWRRRRVGSELQVPLVTRRLLLLVTVLLACATASVFASRDLPRSAARLVQLLLLLSGSTGVLLSVRDRPDLPAVLARGARWGIGVSAVVSLLQLLVLAGVVPGELPEGTPVVRLTPFLYAGIVPRLSGLVLDANRTGLLLLLYGWLEAKGDPMPTRRARWLALAALLLLFTLSRSALLALGGMALVTAVARWRAFARPDARTPHARRGGAGAHARVVPAVVASVALLVGAGAAALLGRPDWRDEAADVAGTLQQRFTVREGSARDHLRLLNRGVDVGTRSVPAALTGIGYGSAHMELQDFFPGDRYGNFHSLYVGAFAEMGVAGMLALLTLLAASLRPAATRAPVAAALLFGVFYSTLAEPTFWVLLLLAWVPPDADAPSSTPPKASTTDTAAPRMAPSTS
ncbi:MAG: O-antigen ligase family protein [Gemmatimonadetes bacterium]|nr:O-antigen ligase family protein [Gemmatimonadota bacterium]